MTLPELTTFFELMSIINVGLLLFMTVAIITLKGFAVDVHRKLFAVEESEFNKIYVMFITNYKIFALIFNVVPYIALRIMAL